MITTILEAIAAIPQLLSAIRDLIAALEEHTKAVNEAGIAVAQKDSNSAVTSEDIRKAAQEESDALKKL